MSVDKIKPITREQQKDVDKNPPKVEQRLQSESRYDMIRFADLSQDELDLLKEIGNIERKTDIKGKAEFSYSLHGEKCISGHDLNDGTPYLRIANVKVLDGEAAEKVFSRLQRYEFILEEQRGSAIRAEDAIMRSRLSIEAPASSLADEKDRENEAVAEKLKSHMLSKMSIR